MSRLAMSFFNMFKNKNQPKSDLEKQIELDGVDHAIERLTQVILKKIRTEAIAYQFVLEELEGASMGNSLSKDFVRKSGIGINEYKGAMDKSMTEVDGPDGPQQFLRYIGMQLSEPLRVQISLGVLEGVMKHFSFGSFKKIYSNNVRLKLEQENSEIVAIAVNEKTIYINLKSEDLYPIIMQPDSRYTHNIDGRAVVFSLREKRATKNIEIFLAVGGGYKNLQNLLDHSIALIVENFPNLVSYDKEYEINTYDDEDSRVMKKDDEMLVMFNGYDLNLAYMLGEDKYDCMPYRTYLSKYTDYDSYVSELNKHYFEDK